MKKQILKDGFYFFYIIETDIISVVSIHRETNLAIIHGDAHPYYSIEEFEKDIKSKKYKLLNKIEIPK